MQELVEHAWNAYRRADDARVAALVRPSIPILFFGNHERYVASRVRVVTVGLNPSRNEFPVADRFLRFPAARWDVSTPPEMPRFLRALADYFRERPYNGWFKPAFEELLRGMGASYYDGAESIALHTDICSPLATDPTWSRLGVDRSLLAADGIELWHRLVGRLEPDVILISVARAHLDKIRFRRIGAWRTLYTVERNNPFRVEAVDLEVCTGKRTLLVFGRAANLPFGTVSGHDKRAIGDAIGEAVSAR